MSKKHRTKTQGKTHHDDHVPEITPEFIAEIGADIAASPIAEEYKAMFLFAIVRGTFNLDLYQQYRDLLTEYRLNLQEEAKQIEEEINRLEERNAQLGREIGEAAAGAYQEIEAFGEHVVDRAHEQVEKIHGEKHQKEVENIREKLKKK